MASRLDVLLTMSKATVEQNDSLVAKAATLAIRAHADQKRKGTGWPYIVHPIGVAFLLRDYYPDDPALEAAGYLHDVLEDTNTPESYLRDQFGDDITDLVVGVTNNGNWRLADYVHNPQVLRLKAADTIDNVRDTIRGIEKGHDVWSRFAAGTRKVKTWRKHAGIIAAGLPEEPLAYLLHDTVAHAERLQGEVHHGAD